MKKLVIFLGLLVLLLVSLSECKGRKHGRKSSRKAAVSTNGEEPVTDPLGPILNQINIEEEKKNIKERIMQDANDTNPVTRDRVELDRRLNSAYKTMKTIMIHSLLISGKTVLKMPAGHVLGIFLALIDTSITENKQSIWDQIKALVDAKISQSITRYHYDTAKERFTKYDLWAEKKQGRISEDNLIELLANKHHMLPFNYRDLGYSEELATLLPAWTQYMVNVYLDVIARPDEVPLKKCALAEDLKILRGDVLKSARSLVRKRYRKLTGVGGWKYDRPDWCSGVYCFFMYHLQYLDGYNSKKYEELLSDVPGIFWTLEREMGDSIMKNLVTPINAFFNSTICGEDCMDICPENITKSEINFEYPSGCYGNINPRSKPLCTLPCHQYSEKYLWCPYYQGKSAYDYERNQDKIGSNWEECKRPDWEKCMPLN